MATTPEKKRNVFGEERFDLLVVLQNDELRSLNRTMFAIEKSKAQVFAPADAIPDFSLTDWDGVGVTLVLGRRQSGKSTFVETRLGPWRKIGRELIQRHEFGFCWRGGSLHHAFQNRQEEQEFINDRYLRGVDAVFETGETKKWRHPIFAHARFLFFTRTSCQADIADYVHNWFSLSMTTNVFAEILGRLSRFEFLMVDLATNKLRIVRLNCKG